MKIHNSFKKRELQLAIIVIIGTPLCKNILDKNDDAEIYRTFKNIPRFAFKPASKMFFYCTHFVRSTR